MINAIVALLSCFALWAAQPAPKADRDVLAAMDAWKQARLTRDGAALQRLLRDDITYTHIDGRTEKKADLLKAASAGKSIVEAIDFSGTTVRVYGTTALVKSVVNIHSNTDGNKTAVRFDALQVWLKGPGGWQMVAGQATPLNP